MMRLIQAIHFLLVAIFLFTLPTQGLVDSCDHCVQPINKFCCKRDKSFWKVHPDKKYCCEFSGATEKPPGEEHRAGYSTRCSKTEAPWGMPEREFIIPGKSFCANSCRKPFSQKPYFPECSDNVMPDVSYLVPEQTGDKHCTVTTRNGRDDQRNKNCIRRVSDFVAEHDQARIIYIVHGWNEGPGEDWIQPMVDAIRERDDNKKNAVIGLVSWYRAHKKLGLRNETTREDTTIAALVCCLNFWPAKGYGQSAANAWPVGNILGYLHEAIVKSVNRMNVKIETHCIGFSLGPHVCGFFGKMIKQRLGIENQLTKIIGLDPARTVFEFQGHSRELALNNGDATSVEIFHTNAGTVGYTGELGDVDFYVNGGSVQPRPCIPLTGNEIARWATAQCHHDYSYKLMTALLKNDMPCVFQNLDARNRPSSPMKPFHLKSGPICFENKPAFYIGNLTSPAKHANKLDGRYEIATNLGRGECTIMCKEENICMHQENSEIMNQLIADCRAG